MECAYYFVDGTWNVPNTLTFVGCVVCAKSAQSQPGGGAFDSLATQNQLTANAATQVVMSATLSQPNAFASTPSFASPTTRRSLASN